MGHRSTPNSRLKAGEIHKIELSADRDLDIGLAVKEGHAIFKSKGKIYMGTEDKPHGASGTPGFNVIFSPTDGKSRLRIENASSIDTRIVVYTK